MPMGFCNRPYITAKLLEIGQCGASKGMATASRFARRIRTWTGDVAVRRQRKGHACVSRQSGGTRSQSAPDGNGDSTGPNAPIGVGPDLHACTRKPGLSHRRQGRPITHLAEPAHSARELGRGSELTPPNDIRPVVDEGRVGPICSNKSLLVRPARRSHLVRPTGLEVEGDAPAATPYTIMLLHNSHKVRPRPFAEFLD
jgi:hypothetical protein